MRDVYLKMTISEEGYYTLEQLLRQARNADPSESLEFSVSFQKKRPNHEYDLMPRKGVMSVRYSSNYHWRRIHRNKAGTSLPIHLPSFLLDETPDARKIHNGERVKGKRNKILDGGIRVPVPLLSPVGLGCKPNKKAGSLRAFQSPSETIKKPANKKKKVKSKK